MQRNLRHIAVRTLLLAGASIGLAGTAHADPADWPSPEAIVHALYGTRSGDAGARRDWDRDRGLFLDGARLSLAMGSRIGSGIRGMDSEALIAQTERAYAATGFHEIPLVTKVEQHGQLASVMSSFEIRLRRSDTAPLMRGLNHVQPLNDGERWWIASNAGIVETPASPLPDAFAPDAAGGAE